ncbi:acetyl-CoA carboxylase biotin carboxyl carrier protein [Erythrobacter sp. EC-HK427]|uniref:acetyl-CoA carboxylase biotin carboxyl carrier protein n=1 Tax=Erythrobacter sp. EC-HK427 TaxID=2038396 RepID=UPI00125C3800|nr:acetyl-CoA carboxylase biotin carboxyl carrier protein [Erythrobacter sp. EC-HK427]VVT10521.1 Biotin carboxyl carrier protein of acetyl-CoA carboxylase [Erythrobacter sp. EC-HK427]
MTDHDLPENLRYLIEEFNRSGLRELHIRKGDFEVLLSHADTAIRAPRRQASAVPSKVEAPTPARKVAEAAPAKGGSFTRNAPEGTIVISAPNLGTFYRSPKPGTPPFVEVGQQIAAGAEMCLIEVMKLFTTVKCEVAGTVEAVLVEDGSMVEAGQPLFAVREA